MSHYQTPDQLSEQLSEQQSEQQSDQQSDSRHYQRYLPSDLRITVAWPGLSGCLRPDPKVICRHFSGTGLHFGSTQAFAIGEKLILDIDLADIHLTELAATVISSYQTSDDHWSTEAKFCFINKRMQTPGISCNLLQIAAWLGAAKNLRNDLRNDLTHQEHSL